MIPPEILLQLLPKAVAWIEGGEAAILKNGEALAPKFQEIARQAGVKYPEKVRLLSVPQIPLPTDSNLRAAVSSLGIMSNDTLGLTMRYGIYLRSDYADQTWIMAHELKHTAQYEVLGVSEFLTKYALQCNDHGYRNAPLEVDAIQFGNRFSS